MSYIVRVVGYNAYCTGDTSPGKYWSTSIQEAKRFEDKSEAQIIVDSGNNMEVVDYNFATNDYHQDLVDWDEIDRKLEEIKNTENISVDNFETISDEVEEVDVEVLD